jgi:hypothetical protein
MARYNSRNINRTLNISFQYFFMHFCTCICHVKCVLCEQAKTRPQDAEEQKGFKCALSNTAHRIIRRPEDVLKFGD